jgi:hypothetical protein
VRSWAPVSNDDFYLQYPSQLNAELPVSRHASSTGNEANDRRTPQPYPDIA